jgi:hypothetical protein
MDLTVVSVVERDLDTFDLMIRSVLAFTDFVPRFLICLNDSTNIDPLLYRDLSSLKFVSNSPNGSGGSLRHGAGLDRIVPFVETKYVAILESDCVVLDHSWYRINVGKKFKAASKGKGLYHVCFLVAETELLKDISFMPKGTGPSYRSEEDVGWQIGRHIREDQTDYMDLVDCKTEQARIFTRLQSDEIYKDGVLVGSHFGRGSNLTGKKQLNEFGTHEEQLNRWKDIANRLISKEEDARK